MEIGYSAFDDYHVNQNFLFLLNLNFNKTVISKELVQNKINIIQIAVLQKITFESFLSVNLLIYKS